MVMQTRNVVILGGMSAAILLGRNLGFAMLVSGAIATVAVLSWNVVWVNTVLFRITKEEAQFEDAQQK
jgi:hypothetical protein